MTSSLHHTHNFGKMKKITQSQVWAVVRDYTLTFSERLYIDLFRLKNCATVEDLVAGTLSCYKWTSVFGRTFLIFVCIFFRTTFLYEKLLDTPLPF